MVDPITPDGCGVCGDAQDHHGQQYHPAVGNHGWQKPTDAQRLERMQARRAARLQPKAVEPVPEVCVVTLTADAGPAVRGLQNVAAELMFAFHPDLRGGA